MMYSLRILARSSCKSALMFIDFFFQKSYQQPISPEFQKKYANIVLELDNLNKDLNEYLIGVQQYCQEVSLIL